MVYFIYPWTSIIDDNIIRKVNLASLIDSLVGNVFWFGWENFFSNSIKLLSHYVWINFSYWAPFLFFSMRPLYFSTWFLCFLVPVWPFIEFSITFHLVSEFLFFVLFRILWMLASVNKAKFLVRKTFNKIPALLWSECWLPCIRLSLHQEKRW